MTFFENGSRDATKQERHTVETSLCLEENLKNTLRNLANNLFGDGTYTKIQKFDKSIDVCINNRRLLRCTCLHEMFLLMLFRLHLIKKAMRGS